MRMTGLKVGEGRTSDLNVIRGLYKVRASDGTVGDETGSIARLSLGLEQGAWPKKRDRLHALRHHATSIRWKRVNRKLSEKRQTGPHLSGTNARIGSRVRGPPDTKVVYRIYWEKGDNDPSATFPISFQAT